MAQTVPTIMTRTEPIANKPLCNSLFTCWPYLVSGSVPIISDLIFSCGKATVGTSHSKKSHNMVSILLLRCTPTVCQWEQWTLHGNCGYDTAFLKHRWTCNWKERSNGGSKEGLDYIRYLLCGGG